jgi:hypothetical protein
MELESEGKRACVCGGILAGDRLSALPDCMIHHIMSFMKARQVVQTCVLSTRWRHLWRSVPSLDIDEEFRTAGGVFGSKDELVKFGDFTDHLIIHNSISIALLDTFRLHVTNVYRHRSSTQAAKLIRHGIKYNTQAPGILRDGLNSTSWRLKRLHLSNIWLDDCFTKHVSSSCHYLEDLELQSCICIFPEIISHTLKNLILKRCTYSFSEMRASTLKNLVIDNCARGKYSPLIIMAPAVMYLFLALNKYHFAVQGGVSFNEMPSLVKAHAHLSSNYGENELIKNNQAKLLGSLSNVTSLELLGFTTMACIFLSFPMFPFSVY